MIPFEKDEWESWRDHPITGWFVDFFLAERAKEAKQTFIDYAWGKKEVDAIYHAALFERAAVLDNIRELQYEDLEAN